MSNNGATGSVNFIYTDQIGTTVSPTSDTYKTSIIFGDDGSLWAQGKQYIPANAEFTDTIKNIIVQGGTNINKVGTPSITATNSGSNTTLTFNYLKGATGATGVQGPQGEQGPIGNINIPPFNDIISDSSRFTIVNSFAPSDDVVESMYYLYDSGQFVVEMHGISGLYTKWSSEQTQNTGLDKFLDYTYYNYDYHNDGTIYIGKAGLYYNVEADQILQLNGDGQTSYQLATTDDIIQSDWNQTNSSSKAYIKNKPSIASTADDILYNGALKVVNAEQRNNTTGLFNIYPMTYTVIDLISDWGISSNNDITLHCNWNNTWKSSSINSISVVDNTNNRMPETVIKVITDEDQFIKINVENSSGQNLNWITPHIGTLEENSQYLITIFGDTASITKLENRREA